MPLWTNVNSVCVEIKLTYLNAKLVSREGCDMTGPHHNGVADAFSILKYTIYTPEETYHNIHKDINNI